MTNLLIRNAADRPATWFLHDLVVPLVGSSDTAGTFGMVEGEFPAGDVTPLHLHQDDHEAWYVLEGEVTFHCGGEVANAGPGDFVWAPKGVPHALRVGDRPARMLVLAFPGRFIDFVSEMGVPAAERRLPDPQPLDPDRLAEVASRHGITILGPPPE